MNDAIFIIFVVLLAGILALGLVWLEELGFIRFGREDRRAK